MQLKRYSEHTLAEDLLTPGGWVLDGGSHKLAFSLEMARLGMNVLAVDPSPRAASECEHENVRVVKAALVPNAYVLYPYRLVSYDNGAGDFLLSTERVVPAGSAVAPVGTVSLAALMEDLNIEQFEAIKLDIEGSEYDLLESWPGPITKQLTVEFHDFRPRFNSYGVAFYDRLLRRLGLWYTVVQHEKTRQHGLPDLNYWDSLFVLKELV